MYPRQSSLAFFCDKLGVEVREGGWVGGRRDYVTKLPAWHGRQMEPQMCVKSGSLETLQRRREERGGGSSRSVALTPPCLSPGFSC